MSDRLANHNLMMAVQAQYDVVEQEVSVNDGHGAHSSGAGCNHTKPRIIHRH
jgi:hypothetical protein